jgi:hypothetical protein
MIEQVLAHFHSIALQEIKWVLKHCLLCFPPRRSTRQQVENTQVAGSPATNRCGASIVASTTLTSTSGVRSSLGATSPQTVIVVGVATVFIPEIAQGQDILVVYEVKRGRVNLSAFSHASPALIVLGLANWATYRPAPQCVHSAENYYGAGVLCVLDEQYDMQYKLGNPLPLVRTHSVEKQIRDLVVGYFRRNKYSDWESALQAANVKLNAKGLSMSTLGGSGATHSASGLAVVKDGQENKKEHAAK